MANEDTVRIPTDSIYILACVVLLAGILLFSPASFSSPFGIALLLSVGIIGWAAIFAYKNREKMSEMHGMMNGMAFSMMASFAIGTVVALPSGDFILGIAAGTVAGLLLGIPVGKSASGLARMEGIMAAPMGGSMGAMLGVMIRFYNVHLFMQFLFITLIFIMYEMTKINSRHCECAVPATLKYFGVFVSAVALLSTFAVTYAVDASSSGINFADSPALANGNGGSVQEVTLNLEALRYSPDTIVVKNNIPVKMTLKASSNAGCTRSIVFPDFGISKVVPRGGSEVIEFTPTKPGTYQFRCSMNMARGTLLVQN